MSNALFPTLPGIKFGRKRSPQWRTNVKTTASGREYRGQNGYSVPRYVYSVPFEFLRSAASYAEFQTLLGFYNARGGRFDSFLYNDVEDNAVTAQAFGTGNAVATQFQLVRTLGGFVEPVYAVNGSPSIFIDGVLQASGYTIDGSGVVTFSAAPGNGLPLTWTGNYHWRCRFNHDQATFEELWELMWETRALEFITIKP